ncbi:MAG: glycosyltransferase, partial [Spirochaetota bacterium]|nr:glycosyltransferase [Spirochaetota bacterium]
NLAFTIMEPLACGTPVVAFDVGGNSDMIEHKKNGFLAKPYDISELAKGIHWVLEDDKRFNALAKRAVEKVEQEFTYDIMTKKYLDLYESILKKDPENE